MHIELIVQSGHYLPILDVAFSPDGALIATASPDESARLWDVRAGCEAAVLKGHHGPVYRVAFSGDGRLLATCGWDHTVRLWSTEDRTCRNVLVRKVPHPQMPVDCVAWSPSGRLVAASGIRVGDLPSPVSLWDSGTGALVRTIDVPQAVLTLVFRDDEVLAAGMNEGGHRVRLLDVASGKELAFLHAQEAAGPPTSTTQLPMAFTDGGRTLLFASGKDVRLVDAASGEETGRLPCGDVVRRLSVRADGTLAVFGASRLTLWDTASRKLLEATEVRASCMSPDGSLLARGAGRYLEILDRRTARVARRLGTHLDLPDDIGNLRRQFVLAANPMYPVLASAAPDGLVRLWDLRVGGRPRILRAHERFVAALAFDPRGEILASAGEDGGVRLWRVRDGSPLRTLDIDGSIAALDFSADGSRLAVGRPDGGVTLFEVASGGVLRAATAPHPLLSAVVFASPAGEVAAAAGNTVVFWDARLSRKHTLDLPLPLAALARGQSGVLAVAGGVSKWLGTGAPSVDRGFALLLDPRDGGSSRPLATGAEVRAVAFDLDGATLATGDASGVVTLWDVDTGARRLTVDAHAGDVTGVAFTSDGAFVASTGLDATVRLWEAETGRLALTLLSLDDEDYVAVTDEGHYSATKRGLRSIMFRSGGRIFPVEQFDLKLNRPDRVLARTDFAAASLVEAYAREHARRLKRLGLEEGAEADGDVTAPELRLTSPVPAGVSGQRTIALDVKLTAGQRPLDRLLVYGNDVPVHGRKGLDARALGMGGDLRVSFDLASGDNKIQLCAVDAGNMQSTMETFRTVLVTEQKPSLFVLAVGVSRYRDPALKLDYAAKDARDLAAEMERLGRRFARVESRVLTDERATRGAILESRAFLERTQVDDHVLLLFAGHGALVGLSYFFLPWDADPAVTEPTAVSYEEIQSLLDGIPARRRLVLLDTCHAGEAEGAAASGRAPGRATGTGAAGGRGAGYREIAPDVPARPPRSVPGRSMTERLPEIFADLRRDSGASVIAASGSAERASEIGELENGVFTSCVLQALRKASAGGGSITVSELHRFVSEHVAALTRGEQRPVSRHENLADDFPIL